MQINWLLKGEKGMIRYVGNDVCEAAYSGTKVKFPLKDLPEWINRLEILGTSTNDIQMGNWGEES